MGTGLLGKMGKNWGRPVKREGSCGLGEGRKSSHMPGRAINKGRGRGRIGSIGF